MAQPVRVALLGCGTVGSAVVRLMHQQAEDLTARIGAPLELVGVAVRRPNRDRGDLGLDRSLFTADALGLVKRDDVDIVVEVVGGIEPARTWLTEALRGGKSVVTGNKALLAEDGGTIHDAAAEGGADLYYEAAVAGAIPLLRPLRESLHGDRITQVTGIVNGTTNFILSAMDASGMGFEEALEQATELGYAEPDPTADIEGFDAAAKAAILASLAFHTRVTAADVYREGITEVTATDMASAHSMGATIKLLCIATRTDAGGVAVRVHPAMIPRSHPLASVGDAFNAVFIEADAAGQLMFYGRGAGGAPSASAVLGDIVAVARNRIAGHRAPSESSYAALPVRPMGEVLTRYHVSLDVADRAGVLAAVANVFARQDVSIATVRQSGRDASAQLVIVTHTAPDAALRATVEDLRALDIVRSVASVLRVEGGEFAMNDTGLRRPWRGVIDAYRERLPVSAETEAVTLYEGNTPLVPAAALSARTGCEVFLKVEGSNPTGSFKDRGMTVAVTRAVEDGSKAIICASTGNTSASAAAYAARAGIMCAVLVPQGKIALGKLAQALVHGARLLQVAGNFDDCLALASKLAIDFPVSLVNSVNPDRLHGQKTAAFEIVAALGDAPDIHCIPVGNAGNICAYWMGYTEDLATGNATQTPKMYGFQAAGAAPLVSGQVVAEPSTIATAIRIGNPASWTKAIEARDASGGLIAAVTDREILSAYRMLARTVGVFVELGSAASVAGLLQSAERGLLPDGGRVVCTVTGHGLKDPEWAISTAPAPTTVTADVLAAARALDLA